MKWPVRTNQNTTLFHTLGNVTRLHVSWRFKLPIRNQFDPNK